MNQKMKILVGCETSGRVRDAFAALGHDAWSCDLLPSLSPGKHYQGNLLDILGDGWDMGIFHPTCTYLTNSAEWAYKDPDFSRYPGVGYHQKVKPSTLTGAARRQARLEAVAFVLALAAAPIPRIAIENPTGALSALWRKADQTIQPYQFGADASKATGLWLKNLPLLRPTNYIEPRAVCPCGFAERGIIEARREMFSKGCPRCGGDASKVRPRWANQTDSGQNKLTPGADRWKERSATFPGIADAMGDQWGKQGDLFVLAN